MFYNWYQQRRKKISSSENKNYRRCKDDELVLSSFGVMLEVNERVEIFYKTMRDIVERTYRRTFHLQYKNQSNDSKNQVISKLQEVFPVAIEKTYNNKKESFKK
jgi:hypothetical protein